jgi:hypothetical protein
MMDSPKVTHLYRSFLTVVFQIKTIVFVGIFFFAPQIFAQLCQISSDFDVS